MANKVKHSIGIFGGIAMVCAALVFDLVSIIPFVNIAVAIVAWIFFVLWFYLSGVSFSKHPHILGVAAGSFIIGTIPFLSMLPEITAGVAANIVLTRMQEKNAKQPTP